MTSVGADPTPLQDDIPLSRPHSGAEMGEAEERRGAEERHTSVSFNLPSEAHGSMHKSTRHVFHPDVLVIDCQPRTDSNEDHTEDSAESCAEMVESECSSSIPIFSIEQAEPLNQGLSGGTKVTPRKPSDMQVDKPGSLVKAASDGVLNYFLV